MKEEPVDQRRALLAAVIGGLLIALYFVVFGGFLGRVTFAELAGSSLVFFAITFVSLLLGGRRGIVLLWALMLVLWITALYDALDQGHWDVAGAVRLLPDAFAFWSLLALPLSIATVISLRRSHTRPPHWRFRFAGLAIWLCLVTASSYLAQFAPDVGSSPRDNAAVVYLMGILLPPFPFLLSGWLIQQLRH